MIAIQINFSVIWASTQKKWEKPARTGLVGRESLSPDSHSKFEPSFLLMYGPSVNQIIIFFQQSLLHRSSLHDYSQTSVSGGVLVWLIMMKPSVMGMEAEMGK